MNNTLSVTLVHALPGRIRILLSDPPRDGDRFTSALRSHEGVRMVSFSPISKSTLIEYGKGHLTTEEIMLRSAVALSFEYDDRPVQILTQPKSKIMTDGAVLSGILLAGVAAVRWSVSQKHRSLIDYTAGAGVALAVIEHGWREAREQGYIHPELLSLGYLIVSGFRRNVFRGAVITWVASFGRHLLSGEEQCIEIRPLTKMNEETGSKSYEVKVAKNMSGRTPLLNMFRSLLGMVGIASFAGGYESLLGEFQNIARAHGEVLEGMGDQLKGIPLVFK